MRIFYLLFLFFLISKTPLAQQSQQESDQPPIYIAFLWHMHQPLYWPGETILETEANNYYPYSVFDIHNQRTGPYTNWPANAVQKGMDAELPHAGASVSFSGSLIENLNLLEANGNGNFQNWTASWNSVINQTTEEGNPRMDMIGFGYYHPLMGLIDTDDIRAQIQKHKEILASTFDGNYSKGIFPPENAFSTDMIPALANEGLEWVLVDNIHFDRAAVGYPYSTSGNLYEPNKADVQNPDPQDWVQLNNLWAPTKVSAQWGHQPHFVEYTDPKTGENFRIIAVPTSRYLGNEDGRGGFGALQYESVMSQLEAYNTDPDHPILIVLHHDGDNFGGGSEGYYNGNFQAFVDWAAAQPDRFVPTTIQDYLDQFPPKEDDVIHVESGSWAGADNGDPEFKKWLGDPGSDGYSPDRNSWGVVTAAKNFVDLAVSLAPNEEATQAANTYLLNAQASDYWYWDNSIDGVWDTHPTTASNLAISEALSVIGSNSTDRVAPTVFKPQREPYNPGGTEWGISQPNDFDVWTYVFDVAGLNEVRLRYKSSADHTAMSRTTRFDEISPSDTSWKSILMTGVSIEAQTNAAPAFKAQEYSATISGYNQTYIEYFVEAEDVHGNMERSAIQYTWVGSNSGSGGNNGGGGSGNETIAISPVNPTKEDVITLRIDGVNQPANLHWGINNNGSTWTTPDEVYWPEHTVLFNNSGPAVETAMSFDADSSTLTLQLGPFNSELQEVHRINFVIHYEDDSWDNNNGNDYLIDFGTTSGNGGNGNTTHSFEMDGALDDQATLFAQSNELRLYLNWEEPFLYVATESATSGNDDKFIFLSDNPGELRQSPWSKSGQVSEWTGFLANETDNNYHSWFDQTTTAESASGAFLEGVINIEEEYGEIPSEVFLAIGSYETNDGGALIAQLPSGDDNGDIDPNEWLSFNYQLTVAMEEVHRPEAFKLMQNYPNPFNPTSEIVYEMAESALVTITVYDILGREISTLIHARRPSGLHSVRFDARSLSSGMYLYQMRINGQLITTKRMTLLK